MSRAPRSRRKAAAPSAPAITLPVPAPLLRRGLALGLGGVLVAGGLVAAALARLPDKALDATRLATAEAGFQIRHVEISGNREMPRLKVYEAVLAGPDNALLAADLANMRQRLRAHPWVADASVSRRLPDTLVVRITERRPVALWQNHGEFRLIDISGRVLARPPRSGQVASASARDRVPTGRSSLRRSVSRTWRRPGNSCRQGATLRS